MDGFRRPQTPRKKGERPPGGQKGHKGHTLSLAEPDFVIPHTVTNCSHCGASLKNVKVTFQIFCNLSEPCPCT
jgi:hypothetical protein